MKMSKITPHELECIVMLLQPSVPELTPTKLVAALKSYGADKEEQKSTMWERPLTIKETCALLGVTVPTVNRLVKRGLLVKYNISVRAVRIDPASVRKLLNMEPAKEA